MSTKKKEYLNETQIVEYCKENNINPSICYCKDCGKLVVYDSGQFHINSNSHKLVCQNKLSFLTTRDYNGNTYNLCRCYDCVCKKFPEFKDVRFKFAHKAAKYTQYAFDVPDEDFKPVSTARQSVTKEKMIKKYGLTEGEQKWKAYCDKQAETNTFEYKNKKYGMTQDEFDAYNKSRAVTLDNLINRYGEIEGHIRWDEYCNRQRYTTTKQYFIEKYGEVEGTLKFDNFCEKRQFGYISSHHDLSQTQSVSFIAYEFTVNISKYFKNNILFFGDNEYRITTEKSTYFLDYYDETLNIVVEFFGTYYHMDPKKYPEYYLFLDGKITAKEKREKDRIRLEDIQQTMNCKIIVVWESTYRKDKQGTIDNIIKMIDNKDNLENITYI